MHKSYKVDAVGHKAEFLAVHANHRNQTIKVLPRQDYGSRSGNIGCSRVAGSSFLSTGGSRATARGVRPFLSYDNKSAFLHSTLLRGARGG